MTGWQAAVVRPWEALPGTAGGGVVVVVDVPGSVGGGERGGPVVVVVGGGQGLQATVRVIGLVSGTSTPPTVRHWIKSVPGGGS